jgi:hypothetical protein
MTRPLALAEEFGRAVLDIGQHLNHLSNFDLNLGNLPVRLDFRSPILKTRFSPFLLHLAADFHAPSLQTILWHLDYQSPGLPPFPWPIDIYRGCGEMPGFSDGNIYIHFDVPMGALTVLDVETGRACYVSRAPEALPEYECASPLRWLFHRFAVDRGMALVHAGAVAYSGRAALITGPTGSGKSTTTISCLAAGLSYLGDDRCLIRQGQLPQVYSIYTSAKVFAAEVDRFPIHGLSNAVSPMASPNEAKAIINVGQVAPHLMAKQAEIACVITPVVTGESRSRLVDISAAEAVKLLVAEIIGHSPTTAKKSLLILSDVCKRRCAYRLEAGVNLEEVAETVACAIQRT